MQKYAPKAAMMDHTVQKRVDRAERTSGAAETIALENNLRGYLAESGLNILAGTLRES
jgi:hypothetical protein